MHFYVKYEQRPCSACQISFFLQVYFTFIYIPVSIQLDFYTQIYVYKYIFYILSL